MNSSLTVNRNQNLQRLFFDLLFIHHGSKKTIKLPISGGYLELKMAFDNDVIDLIDLIAANTCILGEVKKADYQLGYTSPLGMARSTQAIILSLEQDGMSAEAQLMHSVFEEAKRIRKNTLIDYGKNEKLGASS